MASATSGEALRGRMAKAPTMFARSDMDKGLVPSEELLRCVIADRLSHRRRLTLRWKPFEKVTLDSFVGNSMKYGTLELHDRALVSRSVLGRRELHGGDSLWKSALISGRVAGLSSRRYCQMAGQSGPVLSVFCRIRCLK